MIENNLDGSNPNVIPDFQIRGTASMPSTNELTSSFVGSPNMPTFIMDGFEVTAEQVFDLDPMRITSTRPLPSEPPRQTSLQPQYAITS